jgi:hypothetical protein
LSPRELFEIRKVRIVVVRLEVAKGGRKRIEPVVGKHNGLGILEFGERLRVKAILGARAVGLRSREIRAVGNGLTGQQADVGVMAAF